jgi:hypothetical protein
MLVSLMPESDLWLSWWLTCVRFMSTTPPHLSIQPTLVRVYSESAGYSMQGPALLRLIFCHGVLLVGTSVLELTCVRQWLCLILKFSNVTEILCKTKYPY